MADEITKGNYKATVKEVVDGFGEKAFRVSVLCMTGTHEGGDVLFLKNYDKESAAIRAAQRNLNKLAA